MSKEEIPPKRISLSERKALAKQLELFDRSLFLMLDLIEPGTEMDFDDILQFREDHKNGFSSGDFMKVLSNVSIETAIQKYLETVENVETRKKYKRAMNRVFSLEPLNNLITKKCSVLSLDVDYSGAHGVYSLIEYIECAESAKEFCRSVYRRFSAFLAEISDGIIRVEDSPATKIEMREAEIIYDEINLSQFLKTLRPPHNLIGEMVFLAAKGCGMRLKIIDAKKNVLSLEISQLDFANNCIRFENNQMYNHIGVFGSYVSIQFPEDFMNKLRDRINSRSKGLVFLSERGKALSPMLIQNEFKVASNKFEHDVSPTTFSWLSIISAKL